MMMMMCNNLI